MTEPMYKQYKLIDIHTHIFPDKIAAKAVENIGRYYHHEMYGQGTVDALLESGIKIRVDIYVVHSSATHVEQVQSINDYVSNVVKSHSSFIGFGTLHKDLHDIEAEADRIISLGLKGIKLHPEFQHFAIDDSSMFPVYKAIEGKLPVLMHMGDENTDTSSPLRLARILDRFPGLTVIAAHFGGYRMWDDSCRYLIGRNLYMDTSSSLAFLDPEKAAEMIGKHGAEKFLFGTDYPMWDHEQELERFLALDLTEDERNAIFYRNAEKLFGISVNA